ncbi:MAG: Dam family site-specific DNA-(adenine-N6)-methyltransferase [Chloroflexi bacterium]|nr:Dam family site-specific DNA-(adenine-N6)-methyltransferase [Chloroflexota bacterium]
MMNGSQPRIGAVTHFLRYPGSKRRMLEFLGAYLPAAETISGRYVEPFVGGGAVFFYVNPRRALLSDINSDLIELYRGIRQSPAQVWAHYCQFGNRKRDYWQVRSAGATGLLTERAARVLYLNRTCFKGMWRHNRSGEFNVGYGGQARRWVINLNTLSDVACALRKARVACGDFEEAIGQCVPGDFLFLDPPYRPGAKALRNDHYASQQFDFADHERLGKALRSAKRRGVQWALTTSAHPEIARLFRGNYALQIPRGTGSRPGIMAQNSGELLITTYPTNGERIS